MTVAVRMRVWRVSLAALALTTVVGCQRVRDGVDDVYEPPRRAAETLRAPATPDEPDLDLYHAWRAAEVEQRLPSRSRTWAWRRFTDFVVIGGVAHRSLVLLPSLHGQPSRASFKIAVPAGSDDEIVAFTALVPKFAAETDGVEVGWGVGEASGDPEAVPLHFERLPGGKRPDDWRAVRIDLAPYQGRTIWLVLASRETGARHADWLIWADPRVRAKDRPTAVVVDAASPNPTEGRAAAVPWAEASVFKTYSLFNASSAQYHPERFVRELFPWVNGLRILSALGANYGPTLAASDAAERRSGAAGLNFEAEWADRYEFFRDGLDRSPGLVAAQFDWREFDAMNAQAAASGFNLVLNMAGAAERFTGGGSYPTYRFNEQPVTDEPGWKQYVGTLFAHLAAQPWIGQAAFSFFSEPNCMWVEVDGTARKLGFQGDAAQYARQYLWTWQAMRPAIGSSPVYLGPWVVEPDRADPVVDNLSVYLEAMLDAFAKQGVELPPWAAFSFNLYETPMLTLEHFASYKLAEVRRVLGDVLKRPQLPIRIEELGIHPIVSDEFKTATGVQLGTTRWEMAWHAEMLALLLDQNVASAASWYPVLMLYPPNQSLRAYASYAFLSAVVGALDWRPGSDGDLTFAAVPPDRVRPATASVHLGTRSADRIGYVAATDPTSGTQRIALWRYPRFMATDDRLTDEGAAATVQIRLPTRPEGRWRVRVLGYEDLDPLPGAPGVSVRRMRIPQLSGLPAFALRETDVAGAVSLTMAPAALYLVEIY